MYEIPHIFKESVFLENMDVLTGNPWVPVKMTLRQVEENLIWDDRQLSVFDV